MDFVEIILLIGCFAPVVAVAFKTRQNSNDYHTTVDDKKQCDAILYKGRMVAVCNLQG